jgi:hypothetical protein
MVRRRTEEPRSSGRRTRRLLRSLRGRIFLAGFLLGAVPVTAFLGLRLWDSEVQRTNYYHSVDNGSAGAAVLAAWAKGGTERTSTIPRRWCSPTWPRCVDDCPRTITATWSPTFAP